MNQSDAIFKEEIMRLKGSTDPEHFNNTVNRTRLKITELTERSKFNLVESFSRTLLAAFDSVKEKDEAFIASVIHNFPPNSRVTFWLLGKNNDLDNYIVSNKLNIRDFCATEELDYRPLLSWAVDENHEDILENLLTHIVEDIGENHKSSMKIRQTTLKNFLASLLWDEENTNKYSPAIDKAMLALADVEDVSILDLETMHGLARVGLPYTLLKLIERERFNKYNDNDNAPSDSEALYKVFPATLTTKEIAYLFVYTDMPGLSEKILFDESVDLDELINTLKSIGHPARKMFDMDCIAPLAEFATKAAINTPQRRKRVDYLFSAICDHFTDDTKGSYGSPADVLDGMQEIGFDDYVFKVCKRFKGQHLENELGL